MLPNNRHTLGLAVALALTLSACGDTDELSPNSDPDPAAQQTEDAAGEDETEGGGAEETPEDAEENPEDTSGEGHSEQAEKSNEGEADEAQDEVEVDEDDEESSWQYIEEFDEPVVWEEAGLRLSVTGIGLNDATSSEMPSDVRDFLDEEAQVIVVLEMTASNDSGEQVNFFPNQGSIQILREEADADLWLSDEVGGGDWPDGVDNDGDVVWTLTRTTFDEAVEAGELALRIGSAFDEDFDQLTEDVELQITWG